MHSRLTLLCPLYGLSDCRSAYLQTLRLLTSKVTRRQVWSCLAALPTTASILQLSSSAVRIITCWEQSPFRGFRCHDQIKLVPSPLSVNCIAVAELPFLLVVVVYMQYDDLWVGILPELACMCCRISDNLSCAAAPTHAIFYLLQHTCTLAVRLSFKLSMLCPVLYSPCHTAAALLLYISYCCSYGPTSPHWRVSLLPRFSTALSLVHAVYWQSQTRDEHFK